MTAPEVNMACKDRFSGAFLDLFGRKPVSEPAVKFKHAGEISVAAIPLDRFCGCFCIGGSGAAQDAALPGSGAITRQIICAGLLQGGHSERPLRRLGRSRSLQKRNQTPEDREGCNSNPAFFVFHPFAAAADLSADPEGPSASSGQFSCWQICPIHPDLQGDNYR